MLHLVIGGSASGKSEYAESQAAAYAKLQAAAHADPQAAYVKTQESHADPQAAGINSQANGVGDRLFYIAAMKPCGEEAQNRIARHRQLRQGKGFETLERYTDLAGLCTEKPDLAGQTVLVECLSNLTANEIFEPEGAGPENAEEAIVDGVRKLAALTENLIVVSLDVFGEGRVDGEAADAGISEDMTDVYIRVLGRVNARLAQMADTVTEVVYSIPVRQK